MKKELIFNIIRIIVAVGAVVFIILDFLPQNSGTTHWLNLSQLCIIIASLLNIRYWKKKKDEDK